MGDEELDDDAARELLGELRAHHRELDSHVAALTSDPDADQIRLMRLKKQKLGLKDRIARLEDRVYPDILA